MDANVPRIGLGCALTVLACDQFSKALALATLSDAEPMNVLPVFNLTLVYNHGVSFGMLDGFMPWWALAALSCGIVVILVIWLWHTHDPIMGSGLGFMTGGALGNVLDRVRHGAVTDFIDLHLAGYHWPAFNLADVGVVCGAVMLVAPVRTVKAA